MYSINMYYLYLCYVYYLYIRIDFSYSAAVKVVSEITVDAFATKAGLRMNSMAHSSTEAKMSFQMKNSRVIESKLEFPKKRMEIVTFK